MIAYFDCFSGISGDMTLGALLDLGVSRDWLEAELRQLPLTGFSLETETIVRNGITAQRLTVQVADDPEGRTYADIRRLIQTSGLSERVQQRSLSVFQRLAEAEAKIHGCPIDAVHFHEVGAVDAIVDIVGTAVALERMGIDRLVASALPLGSGFVDCSHGRLPVPAPATVEILRGIPVYGAGIESELVTPTGAAIVAALADAFGHMPKMNIETVGYGAGERELPDRPNLLRIILGRAESSGHGDEVIAVLETTVDDMNPEWIGYLMEALFDDGALDVYWTPIHMKKNRPGTLIQVLGPLSRQEQLMIRLLSETTSIGVRHYTVQRTCLPREQVIIETAYGKVQVKRIVELDGTERIVPEFEVCRKIAREQGIPLRRVYDVILRSAGG